MPSPTDARTTAERGRSRPGRRAAAATGAAAVGLTGLLAQGLAPAPAGAAPDATPARPEVAGRQASTAPRAVDCARPTDGRIVHAVNMLGRTGVDEGDVQLWYSPACRSVQAIALSAVQTCGSITTIKAYVVHNGVVTGSGVCAAGGKKAATPWVYDGGIQQAAKGQIIITNSVYATGTTPAY